MINIAGNIWTDELIEGSHAATLQEWKQTKNFIHYAKLPDDCLLTKFEGISIDGVKMYESECYYKTYRENPMYESLIYMYRGRWYERSHISNWTAQGETKIYPWQIEAPYKYVKGYNPILTDMENAVVFGPDTYDTWNDLLTYWPTVWRIRDMDGQVIYLKFFGITWINKLDSGLIEKGVKYVISRK